MGVADDSVNTIFSWVISLYNYSQQLIKLANELDTNNLKDKWIKTAKMIEDHEKKIQELTKSLVEEAKIKEQQTGSCSEVTPEDYVLGQVLRGMAKRSKLQINEQINFHNLLCKMRRTKKEFPVWKTYLDHLKNNRPEQNMASEEETVRASTQLEAGGQAAGFLFSVSGLIEKLKNLKTDHSQRETSQSLKETAKAMMAANLKLRNEENEIRNLFKDLLKVKQCIKKKKRRDIKKENLMDFVKLICIDETIQQLLTKNKLFFKLVDLFNFLEEKIIMEAKKNHRDNVDITFVAHGEITDPMIPASCLLPLPTIRDVVLYSPWNCLLCPYAAYGAATGLMKPQNTLFLCVNEKCCRPDKNHSPNNLLNQWNSMKEAKEKKKIPTIFVSPVGRQEDKALKCLQHLRLNHGEPETNRFIILYTVPKKIKNPPPVTFWVVTLALSLVLVFSRFKARIHLTACLGDKSEELLDESYLEQQYAWTHYNTGMTCEENVFLVKHTKLYRVLETLFGSPLLHSKR